MAMTTDQQSFDSNQHVDQTATPGSARPQTSLGSLPTEVLLQILFYSHEPALVNVNQHLRSVLPPYVRYAKALAAIATCPEGPSTGILGSIFSRVMRQFYDDCWVLPLTTDRIWQIRAAVWQSRWFGPLQFEAIVLELYHSFLAETTRHVKPRLPGELIRLREHARQCRTLDMISGEEFVAGVRFRGRRSGRRRETYRADLLVTFNQICVCLPGQEHRLQFWGIRHLYDLPDGLFKTPMTARQVRLIHFLTTLDWHWKMRSVLAPKRNEAFAHALDWAIRAEYVEAISTLIGLYRKYCAAGNEKVLNVRQHLLQCMQIRNPAMLEFVGNGFGVPASVIELFQDVSTMDLEKRMESKHVFVSR